jgi:hypothetical protein
LHEACGIRVSWLVVVVFEGGGAWRNQGLAEE